MSPAPDSTITSCPTQHALLVCWGHFAQQIDLPKQLAQLPVGQKTVKHTPAAKLLTLLLAILAGNEFLQDISQGSAPISRDLAVAAAWAMPALPDASGVSRTLAACTAATLTALTAALDAITQPFLQRAIADLLQRDQPLVLDIDLTGQPVSENSSYPGAAFGYMDGAVHLGYQIAEVCLETRLYGRQWIVGQQHPGDTVSAPCLLDLVAQAEQRLHCHPRRRTELLAERIQRSQQALAQLQQQITGLQEEAAQCLEREQVLDAQLASAQGRLFELDKHPISSRQANPHGAIACTRQQIAVYGRQLARSRRAWAQAVQRSERYAAQLLRLQAELETLKARRTALIAENEAQVSAPRCIVRMDAGFWSGENLTTLIELGYDVETKASGAGLVQALLQRVDSATRWTQVGKNAEMVGWSGYQMSTCPYPLTVALERFHSAEGTKHAVLVRNQDDPNAACPDLRDWFTAYNRRQLIEAGVKQEKSVFHIQHLMSRQPIGMQIQVALTLFAANFVSWSKAWLAERLYSAEQVVKGWLEHVKTLVRVGANSPALVEQSSEQLTVRFGPLSSMAGVVIALREAVAVQLDLPLFACSPPVWT